jgi:hypothetical protein
MKKTWVLFASALIGVVILAAVAAGIAVAMNNNPAQASGGDAAGAIRPVDTIVVEGTIESVADKNFLLNVTGGATGVTDKLSVSVTEITKIVGKSGETLKLSDLKAGMTVKAEVEAVMALSYPALTGAIRVEVK